MRSHYVAPGIAGLLLYFVIVSGCNQNPNPSQEAIPGKRPVTHSVEISQMKFNPDVLEVQKGDTIVFVNNDLVTHDITEEKEKAWSSSPLATGNSWKLVAVGTAGYYCSIHPVMKGRIIVE